MVRTRSPIAAVAAIVAALVAVLGGAFGGGEAGFSRTQPPSGDRVLLARLLSGLAGEDAAAYVGRLERRVDRRPHDANTLLLLGLAYQQRARETGDPRFFSLSERALRRVLRVPSARGLASTGLATMAVSRHRFAQALPLARAALRADPDNATAHGALGDALLHLGRYRRAFAAYDRMARLSPSVASYGRVAHARELSGRPAGAAEALRLALTLDVAVPEHRAAALVQLGNINLNAGRLEAARRAYRRALSVLPDYVHARGGLARVAAARGEHRRAAALLQQVVERLPLPQYAIWQGELLQATGRSDAARRAYGLVAVTERVQAAHGVRTELQTALIDLDRGRRLGDALVRARRAYARAPGIDAADVLAWALVRTGRCREALVYSRRALALGTRDALKLFHRAMIERCLGHRAHARRWSRRALATNPYFSLRWAPVARRNAR